MALVFFNNWSADNSEFRFIDISIQEEDGVVGLTLCLMGFGLVFTMVKMTGVE